MARLVGFIFKKWIDVWKSRSYSVRVADTSADIQNKNFQNTNLERYRVMNLLHTMDMQNIFTHKILRLLL
jgi:hypothetical protein